MAAALPCAAMADGLPDTFGAPVSLSLDLTGSVPSRCGFLKAPDSSASLGDLENAGSVALGFTMDCNAPFDIKLRSGNGALSHVGQQPAPNPFLASLDYTVGLSVATDLAPVGDACAASALGSQACSFGDGLSSHDGVSIGTDGSLTLSWTPPAQKMLAGSYQDQITITVEVRA